MESSSGNEFSGSRFPNDFAVIVNDLASSDRCSGETGDFPPGVGGVLRVGESVLIANRLLQRWVPDHDVRVGSDLNRTFAGTFQTAWLRSLKSPRQTVQA